MEIFEFLQPDPVASASLGQVYKARVKETGEMVAVKVRGSPVCITQLCCHGWLVQAFVPVCSRMLWYAPDWLQVQRPLAGELATIDLAILRQGATYLKQSRKLRSDLVAIVDEFGERLYDELNYVKEAANCKKFKVNLIA